MAKRQLGRGLSALFEDDDPVVDYPAADNQIDPSTAPATQTLAIDILQPGKYQPRRQFAQEELDALAQSIRENGILQPLIVRAIEGQKYEIIAGERRWRAAQMVQLHDVPVIIKELSDETALEIALIENLQRQDLSALEEAEGYQRLMQEFSYTQEVMANRLGKSRSHIANTLRLLNLDEAVRKALEQGQISPGHARALLNVADPQAILAEIIRSGLNVRQTEKLVQEAKSAPKKQEQTKVKKDYDTLSLEQDLADRLGLKVQIKNKGEKGTVSFHYKSLDQLDDFLQKLS